MKNVLLLLCFFICEKAQVLGQPPIRFNEAKRAKDMMEKKRVEINKSAYLGGYNEFSDKDQPVKTTDNYGNTGYLLQRNGDLGIFYYRNGANAATFLGLNEKKRYNAMGSEKGKLGFPAPRPNVSISEDNQRVNEYTLDFFEHGIIFENQQKYKYYDNYYPPKTWLIPDPVHTKFIKEGGLFHTGIPIADWKPFLGRQNQYVQYFSGGAFWGDQKNAFFVKDVYNFKFNAQNHGMPISDKVYKRGSTGFEDLYAQDFEKGLFISGTDANRYPYTKFVFDDTAEHLIENNKIRAQVGLPQKGF